MRKTRPNTTNNWRKRRWLVRRNHTRKSINHLKNGKAAGHNFVTAEMMKNIGRTRETVMLEICRKAMQTNQNYRGITLLSLEVKIYKAIVEIRLMRQIIEKQLSKLQSRFIKGHSIQDHIFSLKHYIQTSKSAKGSIHCVHRSGESVL